MHTCKLLTRFIMSMHYKVITYQASPAYVYKLYLCIRTMDQNQIISDSQPIGVHSYTRPPKCEFLNNLHLWSFGPQRTFHRHFSSWTHRNVENPLLPNRINWSQNQSRNSWLQNRSCWALACRAASGHSVHESNRMARRSTLAGATHVFYPCHYTYYIMQS